MTHTQTMKVVMFALMLALVLLLAQLQVVIVAAVTLFGTFIYTGLTLALDARGPER